MHYELKQCIEDRLEVEDIDLFKVLSVYNFSIWFDGRRGTVVLDIYRPTIAFVDIHGSYTVYDTDCRDIDWSYRRLRFILGIDEDLSQFFEIAKRDPLLHQFAAEFRGWRLRAVDLWWALVIGVCQQNASFRQGWKMLYSIVKRYRRIARAGSQEILLPPTPRDIVREPEKLREARVGYRASTILSIASYVESMDIEDLKVKPIEEIEEILKEIKGVGSYTARLAIALSMRRYDLPPIDRWLRALASKAYGVRERDVERIWIERWGKWGALAAIATTIALDAEILSRALQRLEQNLLKPYVNDRPTPANMWRFKEL